MQLKIIHYADIQIEIRTSGEGSQRLAEFSSGLKSIEAVIEAEQPHIVIIPGDVMQFHATTGDEQALFAKHLHSVLPNCTRLILIDGNHDLAQRSIGVIEQDENRNPSSSIESIVTAINSPKISYYKNTGVYTDSVYPLTWSVWSQVDKHSVKVPKPAYSPWVDNSTPIGAHIELFHDPLRGCKDFSGQPSAHFENYGITLADFRANLIIAGDIHAPEIIRFGERSERIFTYSSSLVQRNFGEGDYWSDITKRISGNSKHGYNIIEFDTEQNIATSCEFVPLQNHISRHTIQLSQHFNYETMIPALNIDATEFNKIRIVCQGNLTSFIEHEEEIINHLKSVYQCQVETTWSKDVIDIQVDTEEFDDLAQVIDKEKILHISKKYIDTIVNKTSTIDKDDKSDAKDMIYDIFLEQMSTVDLTSKAQSIKLLSLHASNFMSFSDDVQVDFKDRDITLISGTNGVGKTNIFNCIRWILCDKISTTQSDRDKKLNYSLYFNDTSELDTISGQIDLLLNGKPITITKTLTRNWKKGLKDIRNKSWSELLTGVPLVTLSICSEDFTSTTTAEAFAWLENLITLTELNKLMFVDGSSLTALIQTRSEDLSQEFLSTLGLDVMTTLIDAYDQLKDKRLAGISKPAMSTDESLAGITTQGTRISELDSSVKELLLDIDNYSADLSLINSDIDTKRSTMHQVDSEELILTALESSRLEHANASNDLDKQKENIVALVERKSGCSSDAITADIHSKELELSEANSKLTAHETKVQNDTARIEALTSLASAAVANAKSEITNRISELNAEKVRLSDANASQLSKKNALLVEYGTCISDALTIIDTHATDITDELTELQTQLSGYSTQNATADSEILMLEHSIRNSKHKIQELQDSATCPTCNQQKSEDAVLAIKQQILALYELIANAQVELDALIAKGITITLNETDCKYNIDAKKSELAKIKSEYSELRRKSVDYDPEYSVELNDKIIAIDSMCTKISAKQSEIDASISELTASIATVVQSDSNVIAALNDIRLAKSELAEYESTIADKVTKCSTIRTAISELTNSLTELSTIDKLIDSANSSIAELSANMSNCITTQNELLKKLQFSKENIITQAGINELLSKRTTIDDALTDSRQSLAANTFEQTKCSDKIVELEQVVVAIRNWKLHENSLKLYKKLLGKQGLQQYIFAHLIPLINKRLNDALDGVDFRLQFDQESLDLRFIDLTNNITRPTQFISGMQETLVGLSLIHIFRILNRSKSFNVLMIDEISGKLNDGKNLTYDAKDYKKLTTNFIQNIAQNVNVYIVDHVLQFHNARQLEVQPGERGSIIVEL